MIAHHRRVTNDQPRAILRALVGFISERRALLLDFDPSDTFDHIAVLKTTDSDELLSGRVYIVRPGAGAVVWRGAVAGFFQERDALTGDTSRIAELCGDFERSLALLATRNDLVDDVLVAEITLSREGKCTVEAAEAPPVDWPELAFDRATFAFAFIRDLFHSHYHHSDSDDAYTGLTPATESDKWRFDTDRSLYRATLGARRLRHAPNLSEALGRLAYLTAFRRLPGSDVLPNRELKPLRRSIDALRGQQEHVEGLKKLLWAFIVIVPFTVLEFFVHLRRDRPIDLPQHEPVSNLLDFIYRTIVSFPLLCLAAALLSALLYLHTLGFLPKPFLGLVKSIKRAQSNALRTEGGERVVRTLYAIALAMFLFALIFLAVAQGLA